jgi:hypothetical protein
LVIRPSQWAQIRGNFRIKFKRGFAAHGGIWQQDAGIVQRAEGIASDAPIAMRRLPASRGILASRLDPSRAVQGPQLRASWRSSYAIAKLSRPNPPLDRYGRLCWCHSRWGAPAPVRAATRTRPAARIAARRDVRSDTQQREISQKEAPPSDASLRLEVLRSVAQRLTPSPRAVRDTPRDAKANPALDRWPSRGRPGAAGPRRSIGPGRASAGCSGA